MFRDKDAELERLEKALLDAEPEEVNEEEEYLDEDALEVLFADARPGAAPRVYQNHANSYGADLKNYASGYRAYNADDTDLDPEDLAEQVQSDSGKGFGWLLALLVLVLAAVVGAVFWIYLQLGGLF